MVNRQVGYDPLRSCMVTGNVHQSFLLSFRNELRMLYFVFSRLLLRRQSHEISTESTLVLPIVSYCRFIILVLRLPLQAISVS